jgi:hypothetical protein
MMLMNDGRSLAAKAALKAERMSSTVVQKWPSMPNISIILSYRVVGRRDVGGLDNNGNFTLDDTSQNDTLQMALAAWYRLRLPPRRLELWVVRSYPAGV